MEHVKPALAHIQRTDVKVHAVFKKRLNRAHVTVSWTEIEGLKSTRKRRTMLKQFEQRAFFPLWMLAQEAAGFTVTHEIV